MIATQPFQHANELIGTEIRNPQDHQKLGKISDLVFNPQTGEMFAAIEVERGRYAVVPWQALTVTSGSRGKAQITLNSTKRALAAGPGLKSDQWETMNDPSFTRSVYSLYNLQPPTATGGVGTGTIEGTSTGTGTGTTK